MCTECALHVFHKSDSLYPPAFETFSTILQYTDVWVFLPVLASEGVILLFSGCVA